MIRATLFGLATSLLVVGSTFALVIEHHNRTLKCDSSFVKIEFLTVFGRVKACERGARF